MAKRLGTDSDVEKLARQARRSGFSVEVTGSNHLRWTAPIKEGEKASAFYISALSFGDKRRIRAIKKFLIENGAEGIRL